MQTIESERNKLIATWKREEQQPFTGWDFSYLDGRMFEEQHGRTMVGQVELCGRGRYRVLFEGRAVAGDWLYGTNAPGLLAGAPRQTTSGGQTDL